MSTHFYPDGPGYPRSQRLLIRWARAAALPALLALLTVATYASGLGGGFLFDDYPNIVDNALVQPAKVTAATLTAAAMSSPSSELKRPLSSLSFAVDYVLDGGLDAARMKCTNLALHILNGIFLYALLLKLWRWQHGDGREGRRARLWTAAIVLAWLVAPINLTAVLYVVQRMESLANLFVLIGLLGFVTSRIRLLRGNGSAIAVMAWTVVPTILGVLAKETAVLLPLYVFCVELLVFRFADSPGRSGLDRRFIAFHIVALGLPLIAGLSLLGPIVLDERSWATRDFTLHTRLLSECRVVVDYLRWSIFPRPMDLSFYHDDFIQSTGWLSPASTLFCFLALIAIVCFAWVIRKRTPLISLGLAWFLACHTLTGTILPLELIYEHRNYFASIGVILAVAESLALASSWVARFTPATPVLRFVPTVFGGSLLLWSMAVTAATAEGWSSPLRLAETLAARGPDSPRAQYELGRAYIIASRYEPSSPYVARAYGPLEHAATLPGSSILPLQALIFMNARMRLPIDSRWWRSMAAKLEARPATVQDESSLQALGDCLRNTQCEFRPSDLQRAYDAALTHPNPSARLLSLYAGFAWSTLNDRPRALYMQRRAVVLAPHEPAYRISLARMATSNGNAEEARKQLDALKKLNVLGRLDRDVAELTAALRSTQLEAGSRKP